MNCRLLTTFLSALAAGLLLLSCESKTAETGKKPAPQVFTPAMETDSDERTEDSVALADTLETAEPAEPEKPEVRQPPMPTVAELKKVTPSQEARRALSQDAMQIYRMQPEAFFRFMQSRIPYYRGKGHLKAENDMLRIEITQKEMIIETPKGRQTFPMQ